MKRLIALASIMAAVAGSTASQTRASDERVVRVSIGSPSSQTRQQQGKSDAIRDIAQGTVTKRRVIGAHPMPLDSGQLRRIKLEEQIWKRLGVAVVFDKAPDVVECWIPPYLEGYDSEVDKYLRGKLGEDYVAQVEREVDLKLKRRQAVPKPQ